MSNYPKLLLIAISLFCTSQAMASWKTDCGRLETDLPGACTEIQNAVTEYDLYRPPLPVVDTKEGQTYTPGSGNEGSATHILTPSSTTNGESTTW